MQGIDRSVRRLAALRGALLFLALYGAAGWASLFLYDWSVFPSGYRVLRGALNAHSSLFALAVVLAELVRLRAAQHLERASAEARPALLRQRRRRELAMVAVCAVTVGAAATLAEFAGPRTLSDGVPGLRPSSTFTLDAMSRRPTVVVRTNEHGFRDEAWPPKSAERYRVVLLGDSLVFGSGITDQAETVTRVLDRRLREQGAEAFNVSLNGLNFRQEVDLIDVHGRAVAPDLLVVVHNLENDLMPVLPYYDRPVMMLAFPLGFVSFVNALDRYMREHPLSRSPGTLERLGEDTDRLAALAARDGYDVLVAYVRADCPLPYHRPPRAPTRRFAYATLGQWDPALLFPNDFHPNPRGVEVMAERLDAVIRAFRASAPRPDGAEPLTEQLHAECGL